MLDKIVDLIRNNAGDAVIFNPSIPNQQNEAAVQEGGNSIISTLKNALTGGLINDVLDYFRKGGSGDHPIVREATGNYANDLQSKLGLDQRQASDVASKVIPATMTQLATKTTNPADSSFNIQDIFNQLSGGKTGGLNIQSLLDKDKDGDVDLKDIASMFSGGSGGIMDNVKGMFK